MSIAARVFVLLLYLAGVMASGVLFGLLCEKEPRLMLLFVGCLAFTVAACVTHVHLWRDK